MSSPRPALIWSAAAVAFFALLLGALVVMWKDWTVGKSAMQQSMPECPHEWRQFKVRADKQGAALPTLVTTSLTVPGPVTSVPEYHDCQRLIDGDHYAGLAAVFAAHDLDTLVYRLDSLRDVGSYLHAATRTTRAMAVAEVFLQDGAPYPGLGIELGFNCVFLYYRQDVLEARMLPVGMNESRCGMSFDPMLTIGTILRVRPVAPGNFKPDDIPGVARWDRDPATLAYFIGLGCRSRWCEIGNTGTSPAFDPASSLRVRAVKGWYDEQNLALPHPTETDQWQPAPFQGTVIPTHTLGSQSNYDGVWLTTGYVAVQTASSYYKAALNLDATAPSADTTALNRIEMCRGTWDACAIPDGYSFPKRSCGPLNSVFARTWPRWWARIRAHGDGTVAYRCVTRRDHSNAVHWVPGTARWRWMVRDETIWQECARGCCEIEVGGS